jgi:hypothetical protein
MSKIVLELIELDAPVQTMEERDSGYCFKMKKRTSILNHAHGKSGEQR